VTATTYRGKALVLSAHPNSRLNDVSMDGSYYEIVSARDGEDSVLGSGSTPMDAWHDAALGLPMGAP
jgi:hypothetical protein